MTEPGLPTTARGRPVRRRKPLPMDPRRAPEGVTAEPLAPETDAPAPTAESETDLDSERQAPSAATGIARGLAVIRAALRTMPATPGVYRMLDRKGDALYVGKAETWKPSSELHAPREAVEPHAAHGRRNPAMEIVTTHTEVEALLLESNLIKRLMPRYNVLLRDDKSFPYIHDHRRSRVSAAHQVPRRAQQADGDYFGPFASAGAVNRTLAALQNAPFCCAPAATPCSPTARGPCLLYQIKRCSAPCVGRISREDYPAAGQRGPHLSLRPQRRHAATFAAEMQEAAAGARFRERLALIRDRIRALTWSRRIRTSTCRRSSMPMSSRPIRRAGRPAFRCSFSAAAAIRAIARISRATIASCRSRRCSASFVGQFYENGRRRPWCC